MKETTLAAHTDNTTDISSEIFANQHVNVNVNNSTQLGLSTKLIANKISYGTSTRIKHTSQQFTL